MLIGDIKDPSQIMLATKGGRGVWKMLTTADKGGEPVRQILIMHHIGLPWLKKGGMGVRGMLTMADIICEQSQTDNITTNTNFH